MARLLLAAFLCTPLLCAQKYNTPRNEGQTEASDSRPVNVFFINDEKNVIANRSVMSTLNSIREQHPNRLGRVYAIQINSSDSGSSINRICSAWYRSIQSNRDKSPDFVLDTTIAGQGAEVVELFTATLGLPTLSAQFGQSGDLRNWKDLDEDQIQYLVQVTPPTDLVPEVIRKMAMSMNISNAAILFDWNFTMDHKYKRLLLNVRTRHVIIRIKSTIVELMNQLSKLRQLDIVNFFILGNQKTITLSLMAAQNLNFTGRKYAWYTVSLDDEQPRCKECKNISVLSVLPEIPVEQKQRLLTLRNNGRFLSPFLVSTFYSDLTQLGVSAMKNSLDSGDWPMKVRHISCESYNKRANNNRQPILVRKFDFLAQLKKASNDSNFSPLFNGFYWGNENGFHRSQFDMILNMFDIVNGSIVSAEKVGNWTASVNSPLQYRFSVQTSCDDRTAVGLSGLQSSQLNCIETSQKEIKLKEKNQPKKVMLAYLSILLFTCLEKVTNKETILNHTALTSYRVVTVLQPPFVMYDNTTDKYSGYCIDLLTEIQKHFKFTYEIYQVEDGNFGKMDENGNWNGMIRDLQDKKADIAISTLFVMAEREAVIDFTVPFYDLVGLSIMMQKPQSPTSLFKFLTVLENTVWYSILAAYFFTSLLMWIFDRWSPYSYQNNREKYKDDDEKREFTLKECLWFCMTSLTPQGGGEAPKNLSGRLIAATWWLFGFIIIASYTANLAAFLTVSRLDVPIESLDDLSKQYKIQYATVEYSLAYQYFDRMATIEMKFYEIWKQMSLNDSLSVMERSKLAVWDYPVSDKYTKMFQSMKDTGFPQTVEKAVERVRDSNSQFAYIEDVTIIKYWVKKNCDLQMIGEEFSRKPYAIAVQQGSPLKDQLNNAILSLLNSRTLEKLKVKWWNIKTECEKEDDQAGGISIKNIGGVFIVIFVGIGLACVTLVFEYYYYRNRSRVQERRRSPNSKSLEPIRFNLRPAPTRSLQPFRPRF